MTGNFKARPTTYKGIQMRSRLEAGFAAWLDTFEVTWTYEPRAYASKNGQYLPDFEVLGIEIYGSSVGVKVFVEVKPTLPDLNVLMMQWSILLSSEPGSLMVAVWPDGHRFRTLLVSDDTGADFDHHTFWVVRPGYPRSRLAIEFEIDGPWHGEYWKPKPS